jgi:hypothetical protein
MSAVARWVLVFHYGAKTHPNRAKTSTGSSQMQAQTTVDKEYANAVSSLSCMGPAFIAANIHALHISSSLRVVWPLCVVRLQAIISYSYLSSLATRTTKKCGEIRTKSCAGALMLQLMITACCNTSFHWHCGVRITLATCVLSFCCNLIHVLYTTLLITCALQSRSWSYN